MNGPKTIQHQGAIEAAREGAAVARQWSCAFVRAAASRVWVRDDRVVLAPAQEPGFARVSSGGAAYVMFAADIVATVVAFAPPVASTTGAQTLPASGPLAGGQTMTAETATTACAERNRSGDGRQPDATACKAILAWLQEHDWQAGPGVKAAQVASMLASAEATPTAPDATATPAPTAEPSPDAASRRRRRSASLNSSQGRSGLVGRGDADTAGQTGDAGQGGRKGGAQHRRLATEGSEGSEKTGRRPKQPEAASLAARRGPTAQPKGAP